MCVACQSIEVAELSITFIDGLSLPTVRCFAAHLSQTHSLGPYGSRGEGGDRVLGPLKASERALD